MLILFAFLISLSQSFAQDTTEQAFVKRTNELVKKLEENASRIIAARHHHYAATDLLMNFMAIRPNDIRQDGYQNNVEQSQKPIRDIEDANERMTVQKQLRIELKDDLEYYMSEIDGTFNAADIRKEVSRMADLQDELIAMTNSYLSDKAHVFNPLQRRSGIAPAAPSVRRRMEDSEQSIFRIKGEIAQSYKKLAELQSAKRPPTWTERAIECWQAVTAAVRPAAK